MGKYRFHASQRYAIWLHHDRRCWLCHEPLRLADVNIDHVIPESMKDSPEELARILSDHALPETFRVNGYENWLPAHQQCNSSKSNRCFGISPALRLILDYLIAKSQTVERAATAVKRSVTKDKLLAKVSIAIDNGTLSITDLLDYLRLLNVQVPPPKTRGWRVHS